MRATLINGPAKCGKTSFVVKRFIEEHDKNPVIIAPSSESTHYLKNLILSNTALTGFCGYRVITFDHIVNILMEGYAELTKINKYFFIRDVVNRLDLKYFLPVKGYRGFYEILARFISELKAGEITPELFLKGITKKGPTDKDKEIYAVYSEYQKELYRLNIYDHEGKFWEAQRLIEKGALGPFSDCRLLIVDGFHNFSPAELKIIQNLGKYIDEVVITLDSARDIPDVQGATLNKISLPSKRVEPEKIRIISCPGQVREVEEIAREIKRLNIRPNNIAVLFRDLTDYKELIADIFNRYGIPYYISEGIPLIKNPAIRKILKLIDNLPQRASFSGYVRLLTGLPEQFMEILDKFIIPNDTIDSATFYDILITIAESTESPRESYTGGVVQVLDAHRARGLSFPVVFIGGLIEKGFPKQIAEEPLYGDIERFQLRKFGVDVEESKEKQKEEMFLFNSAVSTAASELILTYPATDNEGKEILTSYYIDEIKKTYPGKIETKKIHLSSVIPGLEDVFTKEELITRVIYNYWNNARDDLTMELSKNLGISQLLNIAAIENNRQSQWNGIITDEDILKNIRKDFGPGYRFSVSQFNKYGVCPFSYFCKRVLGLEPIKELEEEIFPEEEGNLYHAILREYYAEGGDIASISSRYFKLAEQEGLIKSQSLWKIKKEEIIKNIQNVIQYEAQEPPPLGIKRKPSYFEIPFGMGENAEPLVINDVMICGKIDRIDLTESDFFVVVDYKSGGFLKDINLQLPIYIMAAKDVLNIGVDALEAYLMYVKRKKYYHANALIHYKRAKNRLKLNPQWDECMEKTREYVTSYAEGIRNGKFPPSAKNECPSYCDYKDICRR